MGRFNNDKEEKIRDFVVIVILIEFLNNN